MNTNYKVRAVRWSGGWELHIADEGVTQCRTLAQAEGVVREWLELMHDADFADATITVTPDLGGVEAEVAEVRAEVSAATEAQQRAAEHSRAIARRLRTELDLSVSDTAAVLGVSRGRVSQLVS